jgi:hypothetical protein
VEPSSQPQSASTAAATRGPLTDNQESIKERRERVFHYLVLGWTQQEIANALNVSQPTVSQDVSFLQNESAKALSDVVEKALPFQFEKCMRTVEETSRRLWNLYLTTKDERLKVTCLKEIRESADKAFEILHNGNGVLRAQKINEQIEQLIQENEKLKEMARRGWTIAPPRPEEQEKEYRKKELEEYNDNPQLYAALKDAQAWQEEMNRKKKEMKKQQLQEQDEEEQQEEEFEEEEE